jgi:hypothetical protein
MKGRKGLLGLASAYRHDSRTDTTDSRSGVSTLQAYFEEETADTLCFNMRIARALKLEPRYRDALSLSSFQVVRQTWPAGTFWGLFEEYSRHD